jgi:hypothetical protein
MNDVTCPLCGHYISVIKYEDAHRVWDRLVIKANSDPAPSPWHDAAEQPEPCRLCVVEWRPYGSFTKFYDVYYYDSVRRAWFGSNGNVTTELFVAERWFYLDVDDAGR